MLIKVVIDANNALVKVCCVLVPLTEPLRVSVWSVVVGVKGDLLTLSKPKSEAPGVLGTIATPLITH